MREIKFRAWDTEKNIWVSNGEIEFSLSEGELTVVPNTIEHIGDSTHDNYIAKRFIVVQYTGFKDIDKVEIYEGDIIEFDCYDTPERRVVTYNAPAFWLNKRIDDHIDVDIFSTPYPHEKVIGNIYENPELLK